MKATAENIMSVVKNNKLRLYSLIERFDTEENELRKTIHLILSMKISGIIVQRAGLIELGMSGHLLPATKSSVDSCQNTYKSFVAYKAKLLKDNYLLGRCQL